MILCSSASQPSASSPDKPSLPSIEGWSLLVFIMCNVCVTGQKQGPLPTVSFFKQPIGD